MWCGNPCNQFCRLLSIICSLGQSFWRACVIFFVCRRLSFEGQWREMLPLWSKLCWRTGGAIFRLWCIQSRLLRHTAVSLPCLKVAVFNEMSGVAVSWIFVVRCCCLLLLLGFLGGEGVCVCVLACVCLRDQVHVYKRIKCFAVSMIVSHEIQTGCGSHFYLNRCIYPSFFFFVSDFAINPVWGRKQKKEECHFLYWLIWPPSTVWTQFLKTLSYTAAVKSCLLQVCQLIELEQTNGENYQSQFWHQCETL